LEFVIVSQEFKDGPVGLPEILNPRSEDLLVLAILGRLARNRLQHYASRGVFKIGVFSFFEILGSCQSFGVVGVLLRGFAIFIDDDLQRLNLSVLADVPVLDESLPNGPLKLDTELDEFLHNTLVVYLPGAGTAGTENAAESVQSGFILADAAQILGLDQRVLGTQKVRRHCRRQNVAQ